MWVWRTSGDGRGARCPSDARLGPSCQLAGREGKRNRVWTRFVYTALVLALRLVLRKEGAALPGPLSCQSPHSCGCWWPPGARLLPASASHSCRAQQPDSEAAPPAEGTFQDTLDSLSTLCSLLLAKPGFRPRPYPPAQPFSCSPS